MKNNLFPTHDMHESDRPNVEWKKPDAKKHSMYDPSDEVQNVTKLT